MSVLRIVMSDTSPWYSQQTQLSGVVYTLEFYFNVRGNVWMMSILDAAQNLIVSGIPLLIGRNLTSQYTDEKMPAGYFVCLDNSGMGQQPSLQSFSTTHALYFVEA